MRSLIFFLLPALSAAQKVLGQDSEPDLFSYFITRPDIEAPKWSIKIYDAEALHEPETHYWFVSPYQKLEQDTYPMWNGPFIYRTNGELVYAGAALNNYANFQDFHPQIVEGEPMLTAVQVSQTNASARIFDNTYNLYRGLDMRTRGEHANMHDFNMANDGRTGLVLTHLPSELEPLPEADGELCHPKWEGFAEFDIDTNELLFEWEAKGHITMDEAAARRTQKTVADVCKNTKKGWDALHFNAIDKFPDGDYLLSAKNTDTLYKISHRDGSIVWRLGGLKNDFEFGTNARFIRQHHCRAHEQNETHTIISVFNNARTNGFLASEANTERSSALLLALRTDVKPMTAEVVGRYTKPFWHKEDFLDSNNKTNTRGSVTFLDNGNAFVGWVNDCHISEHAPDGRLLMQAIFMKHTASSYRSYKMPWVGRPSQPPDVVSELIGTMGGEKLSTVVHVSWNGATEVASWNVMNVTRWRNKADEVVTSQRRTGFETMISLAGFVDRVVVVGLDEEGRELGRSEIVATTDRSGLASQGLPLMTIALTLTGVVAGLFLGRKILLRKRILGLIPRGRQAKYRSLESDAEKDVLLESDDEEEMASHANPSRKLG